MKNLMLINSMRTASRAFDIGLRAQGLNVPPRIELDRWLKNFFTSPSDEGSLRFNNASAEEIALVVHAVRPLLFKFGFDDLQIYNGLSTLRDRLEIGTLYIPYRDPSDALLSEFNRSRSAFLGDWKFIDERNFWASGFNITSYHNDARMDLPSGFVHINHNQVAKTMNYWNGTIRKIFCLFTKVFSESYIIPYDNFITDPDNVYDAIGKINQFRIIDRELFSVRLNGLANRLLWQNPIRLRYGSEIAQLFVELAPVIPLWRDVDQMISLNFDPSDDLPSVRKSFGKPLGLCIGKKNWGILSKEFRSILLGISQGDLPLRAVLGFFDTAFETHLNYYRQNTLASLPTEIEAIFENTIKKDQEYVQNLLQDGRITALA